MALNLFMGDARYIHAVPAVPAAAVSGDPVLVGAALPGVALTDLGDGGNIATECTIDTAGAYNLPVSVAVTQGDIIYIIAATGVLTNVAAGNVRFGWALETTGGAATTPVKIGW